MATARTSRYESRCSELVSVARAALVDDGLERFAMRDVAARAGMTLGNLQYYYPTRADLLEAIARFDLDRDLAAFEHPQPGADATDALTTAARRLIQNWSSGGSSVWLTIAALAFHDERFRVLSTEVYERFYAALGSAVRPLAGGVSDAEIAARARLITALLDGVALQFHSALADNPRYRSDLTRRAMAAVQAIAQGSSTGTAPKN